MNIFRKVVLVRCSGQLNAECGNYKEKEKLRAGLLHCPECGSRVVEDKVLDKPVVAAAAVILVALLGFGAYRVYRVITSAFEAADHAAHVTHEVLAQFKQAPELRGAQVHARFKNGVLTLTGHVSSQSEKDAIERIARSVPGVKRLIDHLVQAGKPPPPTQTTEVASSREATPKRTSGSMTPRGMTGSGTPPRVSTRRETISDRERSRNSAVMEYNTSAKASETVRQQNKSSSNFASSGQVGRPASPQTRQVTTQGQQLKSTINGSRSLLNTWVPAPPQPAPPYNGPSSGTMEWQGEVIGTELVDITDGHSADGTVTGNLPGVPCMVQPTDPKHVSVAIGPGPENSWKRIVIRVQGKGRTVVRLTWATVNK